MLIIFQDGINLLESVGKTSLITSFLKESFEEKVPACLPEISIPPEVTVDKVQTFIVDTAGIARTPFISGP